MDNFIKSIEAEIKAELSTVIPNTEINDNTLNVLLKIALSVQMPAIIAHTISSYCLDIHDYDKSISYFLKYEKALKKLLLIIQESENERK